MLKEIEELFAVRFGTFDLQAVACHNVVWCSLSIWKFVEHGDQKRARIRLRAVGKHKSHHFSTFRSGLYLGMGLPALISGIYQSLFSRCLWMSRGMISYLLSSIGFQPETRQAIVSWDALLLVYATLLIPVLFALLVGLNIWVWTRYRINYAFIFGELTCFGITCKANLRFQT